MDSRGSTINGGGGGGGTDGGVDKGVDFANYFCTYAFLYHQKEMLSDRVRMDAYCNSVFQNKHHFAGKVFLFHPPLNVSEGDELVVSFLMKRSREKMEVELGCQLKASSGKLIPPKFYIE